MEHSKVQNQTAATIMLPEAAVQFVKRFIETSVMRVGSDTFGDPIFQKGFYKISHPAQL